MVGEAGKVPVNRLQVIDLPARRFDLGRGEDVRDQDKAVGVHRFRHALGFADAVRRQDAPMRRARQCPGLVVGSQDWHAPRQDYRRSRCPLPDADCPMRLRGSRVANGRRLPGFRQVGTAMFPIEITRNNLPLL